MKVKTNQDKRLRVALLRLKHAHRETAAAAAALFDSGAVTTDLARADWIAGELDAAFAPEVERLFKELKIELPAGALEAALK